MESRERVETWRKLAGNWENCWYVGLGRLLWKRWKIIILRIDSEGKLVMFLPMTRGLKFGGSMFYS